MLDTIKTLAASINADFIFWFCALSGSGMFVIQFLLSLFGGHVHHDLGSDVHHSIDDHCSESDTAKAKWLSKQAVTGFLMMFGWAALTSQRQFHLSTVFSVMIGF